MANRDLRMACVSRSPRHLRSNHPGRAWVGRLLLLLIAIALTAGLCSPCPASDRLDADTIKAGLRTTTIEEEGYVARVLHMADEGQIPYSMIDSTFQWARKKPRHKFQYFKHAMDIRIAKMQ